jgi:transcriptional regulator of acetoin/glycerol metabolism
LSQYIFKFRGDTMSDERDKVRCASCELAQWSDRASCRRCGKALPEPIVKIVERVVERVVIRHDPQCLQKLEQACSLISAATERLQQSRAEVRAPILFNQISETGAFPTMAEIERAIIVAAYERSNRKPLEAARLLGIGKTTVYRKLRELGQAA